VFASGKRDESQQLEVLVIGGLNVAKTLTLTNSGAINAEVELQSGEGAAEDGAGEEEECVRGLGSQGESEVYRVNFGPGSSGRCEHMSGVLESGDLVTGHFLVTSSDGGSVPTAAVPAYRPAGAETQEWGKRLGHLSLPPQWR
jgi:hypothetical protein